MFASYRSVHLNNKYKYLPNIFSVFFKVAPLRSRFSDPNGLQNTSMTKHKYLERKEQTPVEAT